MYFSRRLVRSSGNLSIFVYSRTLATEEVARSHGTDFGWSRRSVQGLPLLESSKAGT